MGGSYLGIFVEATVSFLLLVTIGYCLVINRKLENLRSDKSELREIIFSLTKATSQAEQAIGNLRGTAGAIEEGLNERLAEARALESNLAENVEKGSALLAKLSALT
ncbi:MAG: chemotaxis protein, partial [Alphaproteobacteria bacterium]